MYIYIYTYLYIYIERERERETTYGDVYTHINKSIDICKMT